MDMSKLWHFLDIVNGVIWHPVVLFIVLGVGVLFTLWSVFGQYRAVTHGVQVVRGKYDDKNDPGAINHFQALSAALSATVGLGNIGGVAVAIALGGPGAVFWMWMVGLAGMALKMTEVTQSMLFRNTDDPDNPHGGPMFVVKKGFAKWGMGWLGSIIGGIFVITLLISTITGGNMFQAWNVADITYQYFQIPQIATGIILALLTGMVIIGGIKRIGAVAGRLVPFMCILYLLAAAYVIFLQVDRIPAMFGLIVTEAFKPTEASGAFLGGTAGYAFLWGMKRALFSNEAGQGSSPIAHSAAKTDEPVREGVVAGLEPFIDTIVVCTLTTMVILLTGMWDRSPDIEFAQPPAVVQKAENVWTFESVDLSVNPAKAPDVFDGADVFCIVQADSSDPGNANRNSGEYLYKMPGTVRIDGSGATPRYYVVWGDTSESPARAKRGVITGGVSTVPDKVTGRPGLYFEFKGATLTAKAFDSVTPGLGKWLVVVASWLFALSTMISWSYYGEQGVVFVFGNRLVLSYKLIYCLLIVVATIPALIKSDAQLDNLTALGTGVMLWANIPIMLLFGATAMKAYHSYFRRMKSGLDKPHDAPPIADVMEGHDVK